MAPVIARLTAVFQKCIPHRVEGGHRGEGPFPRIRYHSRRREKRSDPAPLLSTRSIAPSAWDVSCYGPSVRGDRAACIFAYRENPILMVTSTGAAITKSRATALNAVSKAITVD